MNIVNLIEQDPDIHFIIKIEKKLILLTCSRNVVKTNALFWNIFGHKYFQKYFFPGKNIIKNLFDNFMLKYN